jgi:hypothetical protein
MVLTPVGLAGACLATFAGEAETESKREKSNATYVAVLERENIFGVEKCSTAQDSWNVTHNLY